MFYFVGMYDNLKIITFESYYDPMLAHIIIARLKANRIACFIADDNILQAKPYYSQLLGGIKIKIFEKDLKKCLGILATEFQLLEPDDTLTEMKNDFVCPNCGSMNGRYGGATVFRFHLPSLLVSLFFLVPLYFRNAWHCFNCGRDFE